MHVSSVMDYIEPLTSISKYKTLIWIFLSVYEIFQTHLLFFFGGKVHPNIKDSERYRLCKTIDSQKLSQEACSHAAQNERLPVQMAVQVLYFEQIRLRNAMSSSIGSTQFLFSGNCHQFPQRAGSGAGNFTPLLMCLIHGSVLGPRRQIGHNWNNFYKIWFIVSNRFNLFQIGLHHFKLI